MKASTLSIGTKVKTVINKDGYGLYLAKEKVVFGEVTAKEGNGALILWEGSDKPVLTYGEYAFNNLLELA